MRFYDQNTQQYGQPSADDLLQALKPIETRYNGYRFRSRTEARWAVLFDTLEIKYEYEKEGFDLICGPYLPDFWLPYPNELNFSGYPGAGNWLEIKGCEPTNFEVSRLLHLALETKHTGLLVVGTPWNFICLMAYRSGAFGWPLVDDPVADFYEHIFKRFYGGKVDWDVLKIAFSKAKSARFEFGEKG